MENRFVYRTNGFYLGFVRKGHLFTQNGIPIAWVEGRFVWDYSGQFRGVMTEINNNLYVLINKFALLPAQRPPKAFPKPEIPLNPASNIPAISLPVQLADAF